jgi:membrane carboxypeptidase/penicillin-binding protein
MPRTTDIIRQRQARRSAARQGTRRALRNLAGTGLALAAALLLSVVAAGAALAGVYTYYTRDLPSTEALQAAFNPATSEFFQTTQIYDRTDQHLLYEVIDPRGGDRQYVTYAQFPPEVVSATVAIEDKTFFTNPGYDLVGISRALISNLRGQPIQGGSSITQQLVKNTLIPLEQRTELSYSRKIREILLAAEITRQYSKEQILEWYINTNFYGNLAYGIDAAALVYFGKHAEDLTLAEASLLAAIPQSPGLNPLDEPAAAFTRQTVVINVMLREGFISTEQATAARTETVVIQPPARRFDILAPHFAVFVRQALVELFGEDQVNRGGLRVITTLDLDLQHQAECAARTQVARLSGADPNLIVPAEAPTGSGDAACNAASYLPPVAESDVGVDHHVTNASVVAIRPHTGEILAMVGSLDYWNAEIDGNFNIAVDGMRQPGSSFKPYTYLEAFRQSQSPATMLLDVPSTFMQPNGLPYVPENYDRKFHGPVSLRAALARSLNVPAVQLINQVGVDNVIRMAHHLGINSLNTGEYGLALTLGGGEVTLLDHTYAFGVLANMGVMAGQPVPEAQQRPGYRTLDPIAILRVEDRTGAILHELDSAATQRILSPELAYLMNHVLADNEARVAAFGQGNPLELADRPAAAKTGTTNDFRDNWTMGYVPRLAVGVWVGNADNTPMQAVTGLTGAAPIWHAVMSYATRFLPPEGWQVPPNVVSVTVCDPSGLLPTRNCQRTREEVFAQGTEPTAPDDIWLPVPINRETGRRATACTPPELVEQRFYMILPPEAADWARTAGLPQPPVEYDTLAGPCAVSDGNAVLQAPQPFAYVRGVVDLVGTARGDNFAFFRLQYGPGLFPQTWTQIEGDRGETVENGLLQPWNTAGLDGLYSVQLVVVKNDPEGGPFQFETSTVQVTVDNQPPSARLVAPLAGAEYTAGRDESVVIQAEAEDNLSLARVVFFVDGVPIHTATVPPYSTRWGIAGAGPHNLHVRAYDAAGNWVDSERMMIEVK